MEELLGRQPPHSAPAEQAVIGAMLIDPSCIPDVIEKVKSDEFYIQANRDIFDTIFAMFSYGQSVDAVTVLEQMKVRGVYKDTTQQYLMEVMQVTPTAANVLKYAAIVRDQANAFIETRNLYAFAGKIRALEKTVENFHAASKSFDCARANAKILSLLEQTDASLVPAKAHEELAALNEEILACRRELERGNALSPERAEHLRSTFRALSENLRDMRERARALREELEPENVEARRAFFRDLRERCAPLINFTKSVLF